MNHDSPQVNTTPKQAELEERLSTLNDELSDLRTLYDNIDAALDRLVGSVPQDDGAGGEASEPQNYIERFDYALGRLKAVRKRFAECRSRLEDAI